MRLVRFPGGAVGEIPDPPEPRPISQPLIDAFRVIERLDRPLPEEPPATVTGQQYDGDIVGTAEPPAIEQLRQFIRYHAESHVEANELYAVLASLSSQLERLTAENELLKEIAQDNHDSYAMLKSREDIRQSPSAIASAVVQRVVELDYTPPENFPDDMVMLTVGDLSAIVEEEAGRIK